MAALDIDFNRIIELDSPERQREFLMLYEKHEPNDVKAAYYEFVRNPDFERRENMFELFQVDRDPNTDVGIFIERIHPYEVSKNDDGSVTISQHTHSVTFKDGEVLNRDYGSRNNLRKYEILKFMGHENPNYNLIMDSGMHLMGENDLFFGKADKEMYGILAEFSEKLSSCGWARPGDNAQDIEESMFSRTNYFVQMEKPGGHNRGWSSSNGLTIVECGKDSTPESKKMMSDHENYHEYTRVFGEKVSRTGLQPFYNEGKEPKATMPLAKEQELQKFLEYLTKDSRILYDGITQLNEGLTELVAVKMQGGGRLISDTKGVPTDGKTGYHRQLYVAEMLENAFGTEKLRDMYYAGPVKFMEEYDKHVGKGKFEELLIAMSDTCRAKHINSDMALVAYIADNVPGAMGNKSKAETLERMLDVTKCNILKKGETLGDAYYAMEREVQSALRQSMGSPTRYNGVGISDAERMRQDANALIKAIENAFQAFGVKKL